MKPTPHPHTSFSKDEIPEELQFKESDEIVRCICGKRLFDGEFPDKPIAIKCKCKVLNTFKRL